MFTCISSALSSLGKCAAFCVCGHIDRLGTVPNTSVRVSIPKTDRSVGSGISFVQKACHGAFRADGETSVRLLLQVSGLRKKRTDHMRCGVGKMGFMTNHHSFFTAEQRGLRNEARFKL